MTAIDRKWAWRMDGFDDANGPFESRAEALEDIADDPDIDRAQVRVGRVVVPDAGDYVSDATVDLMRELMDDALSDSHGVDIQLFEVMTREGTSAVEELAAWARRWLDADGWLMVDETSLESDR